MNLGGLGPKSMSMPSSSVTCKSGDVVPDNFPVGLRVLIVDDDPTCLTILEKMLRNCLYQVTKCNRAEIALSHLRENRNDYDIIISDVHMPDMDGFKLLELVGLEMDLPVIMMSADDSKSVVMKGVTHGACDYLIKPVRIEALKNIWQHVVRKKKPKNQEWKELEHSGSIEDVDRQQKPSEDADFSSSANEGSWKNAKRRKDEDDEADERDDSSTLKKPRVVWSVELHQQFVGAVNQLGIDKAVPKKILELMNVPGLTRENVASHLQKYRLYLRRLSGASHHQGGFNASFMGPGDAAFGSVSSLNGLDFQALAASGQLPAQSLATLQAAALGRPTGKSTISMPLMDQRNLFSFESPKLRFGEGQHQQMNNNGKQVNLLHGIPTNMEPKQLASLQQSAQSFRGLNMVQMAQPQSRQQILPDSNNHLPRLPSSLAQPALPNSMTSGVLGRNGVVNNARGPVYGGVHQASPMVDFSGNQTADLTGNSYPLVTNSGMSSTASKQMFQDEVSSDLKPSRGFAPSYDIFSELNQPKSQDWDLQNVGINFGTSRHANMQGSLDVPPSVMVHQGFSSGQNGAQNRNVSVGRVMFSSGEGSGHGNVIGQQLNSLLADNSHRVKSENLCEANTLFSEQFGQEDLMSALLKQQPEASGSVTNEFPFDGYHLDNLPV